MLQLVQTVIMSNLNQNVDIRDKKKIYLFNFHGGSIFFYLNYLLSISLNLVLGKS